MSISPVSPLVPSPNTATTHSDPLLSRRLLVAIATPLVFLVAVASVLGALIERMSEDAKWLDHSDQVRGVLSDTMKQIVDQETGMRGFLITGDRVFLQPFEEAHPLDQLVHLRDLTADNPAQQSRIDVARQRYERWLSLEQVIYGGGNVESERALSSMLARKELMDSIRAAINDAMNSENALRLLRAQASEDAKKTMRTVLVGLFGALAVVLVSLSRNQLRGIAETYETVLERENKAREELVDEAWVRKGVATLAQRSQGELSVAELTKRLIDALAPYVSADVGAVFVRDTSVGWRRAAGFAIDARTAGPETFALGDGLVGRAAESSEPAIVHEVPAGFLSVRSGTGSSEAQRVVLVPARVDEATFAVVELGFLRAVDARTLDLLGRAGEVIATAVRSAEHKERLRDLLMESQQQAELLQTQQEELRVNNEELEENGNALRTAQMQLEERKEELEAANAYLMAQKTQLEQTQARVVEKAAEVERASRFKSEFLANMSHELRTPLNSTLILAKLLGDNKPGNLTADQIKYANTIYSAGNDLLALINDVLDLSKIEAGRLDVQIAPITLTRAVDRITRMFEPIAQEKKLSFTTRLDASAPKVLETDGQRLEQVLKNLLSNALKFTDRGEVSLTIRGDAHGAYFEVRDTGIGIAPAQHEFVFEAFRQADAGANRKHGGTGLGLSISRDLARLLGGDLTLESTVGEGSIFTLFLPRTPPVVKADGLALPAEGRAPAHAPAPAARHAPRAPEPSAGARAAPAATPPAATLTRSRSHSSVADDRDKLDGKHRLILLVEDDLAFAQILVDLAHEHDFQCMHAAEAEEGLALAAAHTPSAVVLDMNLPDHTGLSVLDRLKRNPATRHVPVHVVSVEDYTKAALSMGAVGYLRKPVLREHLVATFKSLEERLLRQVRRLLVVEDDATQRESMTALLGGQDVEIIAVGSVSDALVKLRASTFDCVVTDLALPDATGFDLLEKMAEDGSYAFPPVIVYTGRSLTPAEEQKLRRYSSSIIVKGVRSPERLLDEVTLFLHRVESDLPAERQRMLRVARDREAAFDGRRILVVEDDVRNVFALTSVLEGKGVNVVIARNGREALEALAANPGIDLVLMDVMMPEMDGLQATREIRKRAEWTKLPIIALTAKAMSDDRERCLEAGVNDYLAKPLDTEILLSLLRVWLPR